MYELIYLWIYCYTFQVNILINRFWHISSSNILSTCVTYNKTLHIYLVYILCCIIILHTYTYIIIISIYVLLLNIYNIMIYIQCIYNYIIICMYYINTNIIMLYYYNICDIMTHIIYTIIIYNISLNIVSFEYIILH